MPETTNKVELVDKPEADQTLFGAYPRIANMLFDQPLLISKPHLDNLMSYLGPKLNVDVPKVESRHSRDSRSYRMLKGGTAVIPIIGELVHRGSWMDAMSGLTSYQAVEAQIDEALADDEVSKIALDIDSPGGQANAVFDLSDKIYKARSQKPVYAVVNDSAYSAAYAIASAASKIFVTRTGGVGSIGVIAQHVDASKYVEDKGYKVTLIYAGDKKADFSPYKALSDDALGRIQGMVNDTYSLFVKTVARNRGLSEEHVKGTQAGIFIGKSGVKAGLADKVASTSEAFNEIANLKTNLSGGQKMTTKQDHTDAEVETTNTQQAQTSAEEQTPETETKSDSNVIDFESKIKDAELSATQKATERAKAIVEMCSLAGAPGMAASLIESDKTVDECRTELFNAKAKLDEEASANGSVPVQDTKSDNHGWDNVVQKSNAIHKTTV